MGVPGRSRLRRLRGLPRRCDEHGGAISLWVVLMVPVSAFAAVVAMAGPQRLAAESSVQEAAEDLAVFAVAWRDGQQNFAGPLPAFPPDCVARSEQQTTGLAAVDVDIDALNPSDPNIATLVQQLDVRLDTLLAPFNWLPTPAPAATKTDLQARLDEAAQRLDAWDEACRVLFEALVRDLGYLGVDMGSLRGSYSDSLTGSDLGGGCSDPRYTTQADCTMAGKTWTPPDPRYYLPCRTSAVTAAGSAMVVQDAVHVAIAANWQDAGWAAAQVWPDGIAMAAESTGRFSQRAAEGVAPPPECQRQLVVLDSQGRPVWAGPTPRPPSRELAQSVRRTTLSG